MTKQDLKNFNALGTEISLLKNKIQEELKKSEQRDSVCGSSPDYPYTKHVILIQGVNDEVIPKQILNKLCDLQESRRELLKEIIDWAEQIEDSVVRQAILLYYTSGRKRTWQWVATKMKRPMDAETIKQCVSRYIRKNCHDCHDLK